jgi:hypothetical protein
MGKDKAWQNEYRQYGKSQRWIYSDGCEYECVFHKGKVEWHHPVSERPDVGIYLCEAHHSLLQGRKRRLLGELLVNKTLGRMKAEIYELVVKRLRRYNINEESINKL